MQLHELFRMVFQVPSALFQYVSKAAIRNKEEEYKMMRLYLRQTFLWCYLLCSNYDRDRKKPGENATDVNLFLCCFLSADHLSPSILEAPQADKPIHNQTDHTLFIYSFLLCYDINSSLLLNFWKNRDIQAAEVLEMKHGKKCLKAS